MDTVLKLSGVHKTFKNKKVIEGLNMEVKKGEIYGFLGENGAGKTTTLKMIMGLLKVDKGNINVLNNEMNNKSRKIFCRIGGIIEAPVFYDDLSGLMNLKLHGNLFGGFKEEKYMELLELVGIKDSAKTKVKKYSLGMKQRLGIARALVNDPELLILDEPSNGLDPKGMRDVREILKKLSKEGKTIIISSHLLGDIEKVCTKIGIIARGKIVREGSVDKLLDENNNENLEEYFLKLIEEV
ncbi:ABC transporter ATP-binding protein [Oceanirhabdus seepicola]|uniref:ATP-binding cassette domain-containing protein n=1 Tax=Oceanirhabdus seepicola TaxID=2828781 RepID=A0A9J6P333_9CLOT|nr:ATP-binding cassette domain-containing protein [Oceanirhabdus seepicola]MCM1989928.1 ATP-binding cassette domain-containing protein [Oceanirhabdus seepicola]